MVKSGILEHLLWWLGLRRRVRVINDSMSPLLKAGDEVLVDYGAYRRRHPQVDDIVIAQHPTDNDLQIVKRVSGVTDDGDCFLTGDNRLKSRDSFSFGRVSVGLILGRVTSKMPA